MVFDKMAAICRDFKWLGFWISETLLDHSKSRLVRKSDPHCIVVSEKFSIMRVKLTWTERGTTNFCPIPFGQQFQLFLGLSCRGTDPSKRRANVADIENWRSWTRWFLPRANCKELTLNHRPSLLEEHPCNKLGNFNQDINKNNSKINIWLRLANTKSRIVFYLEWAKYVEPKLFYSGGSNSKLVQMLDGPVIQFRCQSFIKPNF